MLVIIMNISNEEEKSFVQALYTEYERKLYELAYSILHHHEDAEDCVNDTVLQVIKYIRRFQDASEAYRYKLLKITCRNVAINVYRRKQKYGVISLSREEEEGPNQWELEDTDADVVKLVVNDESAAVVRELIDELSPKYREVLFCRYFLNMKSREIGDLLGEPEANINTYLSRARKALLQKGGDKLREISR